MCGGTGRRAHEPPGQAGARFRSLLADITLLARERYNRQRKEDGVSEATINRDLAFLKNLFTKAVE
jgi:hypothetical protein